MGQGPGLAGIFGGLTEKDRREAAVGPEGGLAASCGDLMGESADSVAPVLVSVPTRLPSTMPRMDVGPLRSASAT
jgi:hypothetical protein